MRGFLEAAAREDYDLAGQYLDTGSRRRRADRQHAAKRAEELARVLERALWVHLPDVSDAPEGDLEDGLPADRESIGRLRSASGPVELELTRAPGREGSIWKVSRLTVQRIPALDAEMGRRSLERWVPAPLQRVRVAGIPAWEWLAVAVALVVALTLAWLVAPLAVRLSRRFTGPAERHEVGRTLGPLRLIVGILAFLLIVPSLELSARFLWILRSIATVAMVVGGSWLLARWVDLAFERLGRRLVERGQHAASTMAPLGRKSIKVVIVLVAALAVLQNFGVNVTALVAGLGIGGIAVALAAQKTVENLFGGIALIADQPIRVGDFCRIGTIKGTVEEIGLRSTRVRTLDRTQVTIPNGQVSAMELENFARRDRIWLHLMLGLRYETTPDQLRHVLTELRAMLLAHPKLDANPRVRLVGLGSSSLDLELNGYVLTTDWEDFLAVREDLFLRILDLLASAGTGLAYPSTMTYHPADIPMDEERRRAAEETIRAARERGELPFPSFPPERALEVAGTYDYPPRGSWQRRSGS